MTMYKSKVYRGDDGDDVLLGEVEIYPTTTTPPATSPATTENLNLNYQNKNNKMEIIRISHMSQPSERCSPLAVLHTIISTTPSGGGGGGGGGISFKMESSQSLNPNSPIFLLHASCLRENKTAVVSLGQEELHLVAMYSSSNERQYPCFWGFNVASGLYDSCLVMLNLRCLGIVFDLDETLVVANTTRSFEDKIEGIQRKLNYEVDPQRVSGMLAEIKRYQEDKALLRQYIENDQVVENGRVIKAQSEVVPAVSDNHQPIVRPIVRFQEKNIVLTRINPMIRDTSVLVRLRPAWEDLRNYLTARGRKRFEVYVCTMAERDYALEMWRLLDPELNLITSDDLLNRIVCVKSGVKKSLFNVFKNRSCHPRMALVIDDRVKVWDEKDQTRVHVVPAFLPYHAPLAEANNTVPTLCVARNVACNVRGGFFKDFDDSLSQRIPEISYEDDINDILSPPDVSNYLVSEEEALNLNKDPLAVDDIPDTEVERRLKDVILGSLTDPSILANLDARLAPLLQTITSSSGSAPVQTSQASAVNFSVTKPSQPSSPIKPLVLSGPPEPSRQSSPAREEGEVPESELDPDTRRRMLILQHGQDTRDQLLAQAALAARPPVPVAAPQPPQSRGNWFPVEGNISPGQVSREIPKEFPSDLEAMHANKFPPQPPSMFPKSHPRDDRLRFNQPPSNFPPFPGEEAPLGRLNPSNRNMEFEAGQCVPFAETPAGCIMDIAMKCRTKVEFRPILIGNIQLQFAMEVWFAGEKVGEAAGRTRREAQHVATEISLKNLADRYLSQIRPDPNFMHGDGNRFPNANDNGFISGGNSFGYERPHKEESMPFSSSSDPSKFQDPRMDGSRRMMGSVSALKELCTMEGLGLNFQGHPPDSVQGNEVYAQVEIDGQVLGKGVGLTWDEAKIQAAEKALVGVKSMLGQYGPKRQGSPRSAFQGMSSKRLKPEFSRTFQRIPSGRYSKNIS